MRLFVWGFAACASLLSAGQQEVTFHKTVEPILQARCQQCHRPGEAAPMSLLSYKEARPWAKAIKDAVLLRKMPPWFADPAHGSFSNDRRLSRAEMDALVAWADSGAKEGDLKDAPPPRTFAEGWAMGHPDAVIQMPVPFEVPASGTVDYTYFVVPTGFTEDKWVQQVEVRPGNKSVVHHIVMLVRPPGVKYMPDAKPGLPYVPPHSEPNRKPDTGAGVFQFTGAVEMVGVYVPGGVPYELQPGQARMIPKGSDLVFQMHYTANGKAGMDQSRIGFIFAKEPPKERVANTFIANLNFRIPPQEADFPVHARVTLYQDATVLSLFPHMHVRGKSFEYRVTYPTGETETLLDVPNYDFNWQLSYYLKQPKLLPKGTVIECVAHFDNSPNNRFNPDPTKEVFWGEQTWEEMVAGFVDLAMPVTTTMRDIAVPKKTAAAPAN
ncbi:conserved exported hypothetical protein [Candidatus Sulfopaludibacter sp. SbA3]|nr:conserved exported hypothetical protein [Candidatus Sulfopaludibacter sp. SbA3]